MTGGASDIEYTHGGLQEPSHRLVYLVLVGQISIEKIARRAFLSQRRPVMRSVFLARVEAFRYRRALKIHETAFDASQYIAFNVIPKAFSHDGRSWRRTNAAALGDHLLSHAHHTFITNVFLQDP